MAKPIFSVSRKVVTVFGMEEFKVDGCDSFDEALKELDKGVKWRQNEAMAAAPKASEEKPKEVTLPPCPPTQLPKSATGNA